MFAFAIDEMRRTEQRGRRFIRVDFLRRLFPALYQIGPSQREFVTRAIASHKWAAREWNFFVIVLAKCLAPPKYKHRTFDLLLVFAWVGLVAILLFRLVC